MSVDVTRKNISNRNTTSVMEDMLNAAFILFRCLIAITYFFAGSWRRSINSMVLLSIWNTTLDTFEVR